MSDRFGMPMINKGDPKLNWQFIVDKLHKMNDMEFRESLRRAGIIDASGRLTEKYRHQGAVR